MSTNTICKLLIVVILSCIQCNIVKAMFAIPSEVPVDRLVANATAYIEENPKDVNGYYVLGRIHYLAFSNKTVRISAEDKGVNVLPIIPQNYLLEYLNVEQILMANNVFWSTMRQFGYSTGISDGKIIPEIPEDTMGKFLKAYENKIKDSQARINRRIFKIPEPNDLITHVTEAMNNFQKAINMDPNNGLYHLGLASLMEQYVNYLKDIDLKEIPEDFRNIILNKARDTYLSAYELSIEDDLKLGEKLPPVGFFGVVSFEAGEAYTRLVEMQRYISETQRAKVLEIQKNLQKGLRQKLALVTPIVFSLEENSLPIELLGQDLQVNFDLDGDGNVERWPWVKPTTGILVWNEDGKGEITSGRQMFGSVTWWLFFNDGYHALDCLDDNRDSALTGSELKGISVWFDINSNGQSEPSEIKSLDDIGIISISVKSTGTENGWPANKTGIKLKTGRTIATYDWIAQPVSLLKNAK
jgi:hypothetical protein